MKKNLLFVVVLGLMAGTAFGQESAKKTKKKLNYFSVGVHGGWTQFYGDIRQYDFGYSSDNSEWLNGAIGGFVNYQLNSVLGFNANVMGGSLGGIKRKQPGTAGNGANSNVKFKTSFIDYTLNTTVNFVNLMYSDRTKDRLFTSYITGGVGFISFRTQKTRLKDTNSQSAGDYVGDEGYKGNTSFDETKAMTTELILPVGLGIKFRLSRRFDLGLEYTQRFTVAGDKLDATVNGKKDSYGYFNMFVAVKFGKQTHSKEWVNPFQSLNQNMADLQANVDGLAMDADGDGVSDIFDKEENTPADIAVDGSGRSLDTDADGVPDYLDADPFTTKGARVDENGKELDSDNDGVADSQDIEPNTEEGALVNFQGKTINLETTTGGNNTSISISGGGLPSIYFKVNSSRIDYWSSYDRLAEVAQVMKADNAVKIKVVGSADKTGAEDYNDSLAEKRAQSAVDHLVKIYGIDAGRFSVVSEGKRKPLTLTDDALNVNRRVDFIIQ